MHRLLSAFTLVTLILTAPASAVAALPAVPGAYGPARLPSQPPRIAPTAPGAGVVGDGTPTSCDQQAVHDALIGGGLVTFACGGPKTIQFDSPETIALSTTVDGTGGIIISGGLATRIFEVSAAGRLTVRNLTLVDAQSTGSDGGAIVNHGTLVVESSTLQNNFTDISHSGGAIFSDGPVAISQSELSFNGAGSAGALFVNFANADVVITDSEFHHNQTLNAISGYGGAIWVGMQARLSFTGGAIYSNTAQVGGALYLSPGAVVTLTSSAAANVAAARQGSPLQVRFNAAETNGGAVFSDSGELHVTSAVFEANRVPTDTVSGGNGGAIYSEVSLTIHDTVFLDNVAKLGGGVMVGGSSVTTATTTISGSAFIRNWADGAGGGLFNASGLTLHNTDFLSNTSGSIGGGAYSIGSVSTTSGLFRNNQCTGANCSGGGLYTDGALALTGTQFVSNTSRILGGGAYPVRGGTFIGGRFEKNQCLAVICRGGGLFTDGPVALTGTVFIGNSSNSNGGGVFAVGPVTSTGGLFESNICYPTGLSVGSDTAPLNQPSAAVCEGGGLYASGALVLADTQFLSNTSNNSGGGLFALTAATVMGGLFQNNRCVSGNCLGGGFTAQGPLILTATRFISNSAAHGGGLALRAGDNLIVNGLFARNSATGTGAALNVGALVTATILHTTIAGPSQAGTIAVFVDSDGAAGITNTIVTSHTRGIVHFAGRVYEDYNLFFDVITPTTSGGVTGGGHSFTANPLFAGPAGDDYHLRAGSAAIDAGVNAGVSTDFEADPRPVGAGYDIGFDEFILRLLHLPLVRR